MASGVKIAAIFACFVMVPACSLFVSLDGLSGDGAAESQSDASFDSASGRDVTTLEDAADADSGPVIFIDDFNRADNALIGNGWIEKNPSAFGISGSAVVRAAPDSFDYPDDLVYRPAAENVRDSEISAELVFSSAMIGYPQIHSRIQANTVAVAGTVDSYLFYVSDSPSTATVSRTRGQENLNDFASATLSPPLVGGERYRLTLRVSGAKPVFLLGVVEHFTSGNWATIGQVTAQDSDPSQELDDAGSVGFSGSNDDDASYSYDNFMRTPL